MLRSRWRGPQCARPVCASLLPGPRCFFFRAEDGIRDLYVTGVQTCALPIALPGELRVLKAAERSLNGQRRGLRAVMRSEERRVGKECRSRWSPYDEKKNPEHEHDDGGDRAARLGPDAGPKWAQRH